LHLNLDNAVAAASFTATADSIEREVVSFITFDFGFGDIGKKISDGGKDFSIGSWVRARSFANW